MYCCSLGSASDLQTILVAEQVLTDVLDRVLRLVLSELLQSLEQAWHDVLVKVLTDGQVGVDGFLLNASVATLSALVVISSVSSRLSCNKRKSLG